jgi:hypothetical protein
MSADTPPRAIPLLRFVFWAFLLAGAWAATPQATLAAASVVLGWNPSPGGDVAGYRLYYGVASRVYTSRVDVGNSLTGTLSNLVEGVTYHIAARSYSYLGLESANSQEITYAVPNFITQRAAAQRSVIGITINGDGRVRPNLNARKLLVGKAYTLVALPGPGQEFAGWSGYLTSPKNRLTFLMSPGLVLYANFVPNPFISLAGTYSGLFYETDQVRLSRAGSFTISVSRHGRYSGRMRIDARRQGSFSGQLDAQAQAANVIALKGVGPLSMALRVGTGTETDRIFGSASNAEFTATLLGERAASNAQARPGPYDTRYTMVIPGGAGDPSGPGGDGVGVVRVAAGGRARFLGMLADGTRMAQSAPISRAGLWPFYVSLYSGKGLVLGWLAFTNQPGSDLGGTLCWIKAPNPQALQYPGGWINNYEATGSAYVPQLSAPILDQPGAQVGFSGGNLSSAFTNAVVFGEQGTDWEASGEGFKMRFQPATGVFKGTATDPATGVALPFNGVLLQKVNTGYGFLLGPDQSSQVVFRP